MPEELNHETVWLAYVVIVWALCALIVLTVPTILLLTHCRMTEAERRNYEWRKNNLRR